MQDTMWLIRKSFISTFKNYKNLLLYFGLPLVAILLAMLTQGGAGSSQPKLNIGIVNLDDSRPITQDAIDFVGEMDAVLPSDMEQLEVDALIASGELDAALVFPAGFADSVKSGSPATVQIISVRGAEVTGFLQANLSRYIDTVAAIGKTTGGDAVKFERLYADYRNSDFQLSAHTVEDQSVSRNQSSQTIGYLVVIMLFVAGNLAGMMIKDRENRTYHRIIASPIAARTYMISNIALNLAIMIVQIAVTLLVMEYVLHFDSGIPFWTLFFLLGLFALVAISLSLVIVVFSRSSMAANSLQSMLFLPTCLLAGCMFPLEIMPETMQKIAFFLPQYWVLDTYSKLQVGDTAGSLIANLLIIVAFAAAFSLVAIYKVGRNNDARTYI